MQEVEVQVVGPAGLRHCRDINALRSSETTKGPDVYRGLSQFQGMVFQRDDGRFCIGLADDAPSFESRAFAADVAALERPPDKRWRPRLGKPEALNRSFWDAAARFTYFKSVPSSSEGAK